jgi:hypothetical protein
MKEEYKIRKKLENEKKRGEDERSGKLRQCYGTVTFWYGSGSSFRIRASGQWILIRILLLKVIKNSQNRMNQGFPYYFCLMTE